MENNHEITWNSSLETLLKEQGEKCLCYTWLHTKAEGKYSYWNNYIALPVIVLSTLSGAGSIGSSAMFGDFPQASTLIGFVSLGVGMLQTIGTYFNWLRRAEGHKIASLTYQKLYNFISVEMSLPRNERMTAKDMLKVVRENMERTNETAPQIPPQIIALFQSRFDKTENIAKPEITNGLDEIYVYKEEEHITTPLPSPAENKPTVKISVAV